MRLPWKRRRDAAPATRRPDYTAIAVMEYDLFGIQPKPGTAAAAIIGMRRLSGIVSPEPDECAPRRGIRSV